MRMARTPETRGSDPVTGNLLEFARAICTCVLLAMTIVLVAPPRPSHAEPTVEELITEYQRLRQDREKANEIAENEKNYSQSEVQKAIAERGRLDAYLPVLKNKITAKGGKVPRKEKTPKKEPSDPGAEEEPAADAELELTTGQKNKIEREEHHIRRAQYKLKGIDPNGKMAELQKTIIERSENRIRDIRAEARRILRVRHGGTVSAEHGEAGAKTKVPEARRPWKLGHWPWDFVPPAKFPALKDKYYRLQAEMGALLLFKRKTWTYQQATDYKGALSSLCALIIDTEERIAFGLGDPVKFGRAIRTHKQEWNKYLEKQKVTDDAEADMNKKLKDYKALMKKAGLKPGDNVSSNNPYAGDLAVLSSHFMDAKNLFLDVQSISERAKYDSGVISKARDQRVKDGVAFTHRKPPKLEIHRGCAGNEPSLFYEKYLDGDDLVTFRKQDRDRRKAILRRQ